MLIDLTQTYANAIYQAHKTPQSQYNEPYNYQTLYKKLQFLRSFHQEIEKINKPNLDNGDNSTDDTKLDKLP